MAIDNSYKLSDYPKWKPLEKDDLRRERIEFLSLVLWDSEEIGLNPDSIDFDPSRLNKIIDMVQRRKLYFHVFHDLEMSELNEICLYVFWILKLRPFIYTEKQTTDVNLLIALKLFTHGLHYIAELLRGENIVIKDNDYIFTVSSTKHIVHAFKYEDVSKEAIMLLAESMIGAH
jgi:hypothetical protein